tara:strand:- start:545 stop:700 length:156 start_codon:yes stop_codon:yes gene_type:complete
MGLKNKIMDKKLKEKLYNVLRQMQADLDDGAISRVKKDLEELCQKIHYNQL